MTERTYALTRFGSGDYLLPSNDAAVLWRLSTYLEDGSAVVYPAGDHTYSRGRVLRGTFWQTARFRGSIEDAQALAERDAEAFLDWERWEEWSFAHRTRGEAIESALSAPPRHPPRRG